MEEKVNERLCSLIKELIGGNINALDEIYSITAHRIYTIAYSILNNPMDAEDIVQDAMLMFVNKAKKFKYNKNAYGWLCTIARNMALYKYRKRKRRKEESLHTHEEIAIQSKDNLIVDEIFSILSVEEKRIIQLKYWQELSLSEIAKELHGKKSTIAAKIKRTELKIQDFYNKF